MYHEHALRKLCFGESLGPLHKACKGFVVNCGSVIIQPGEGLTELITLDSAGRQRRQVILKGQVREGVNTNSAFDEQASPVAIVFQQAGSALRVGQNVGEHLSDLLCLELRPVRRLHGQCQLAADSKLLFETELRVDASPAALGGMTADDIVYTTSVFAHPVCLNTFKNGVKVGDEAPASYPFVP